MKDYRKQSFYDQILAKIKNIHDREFFKKYYYGIADAVPGLEKSFRRLILNYAGELEADLVINEAVRLGKVRIFEIIINGLIIDSDLTSKEDALKYAEENGFSALDVEEACMIRDERRKKREEKKAEKEERERKDTKFIKFTKKS